MEKKNGDQLRYRAKNWTRLVGWPKMLLDRVTKVEGR